MKKYKNGWFILDFNGALTRAKCIDIEFEGGLGPLFLMQTNYGDKFWATRKELEYHANIN